MIILLLRLLIETFSEMPGNLEAEIPQLVSINYHLYQSILNQFFNEVSASESEII